MQWWVSERCVLVGSSWKFRTEVRVQESRHSKEEKY